MSKSTSIPRKDVDFNVRQNVIATTASTNRTAWNLDAEWLDDDVMPKKAEWEEAWAAYENPETRTPIITYNKQKKREAYEKVLWKLVKILQGDPRVTDEDLKAMGIVVPSTTRTPAPVATEAPDCDIDTSVIGRVSIRFFEKGSHHKKGKPDGQHCVEIVWMLSDTPPTRWNELLHSAVDTNSPYTFIFEHDQRGQTIYFALRWENTRGEKGPWSEIMSAIVP